MNDLKDWLQKIKTATTSVEIFHILDEFRLQDWTDEQRALMSKTYIPALAQLETLAFSSSKDDNLADTSANEKETSFASEGDELLEQEEAVWYERL